MAKAVQVAVATKFVMEVAPPPVVTVMRLRKAPRSLDTIAEDDREQQLAPPSDYGFAAAAAWSSSLKRTPAPSPQPRERAAGGGVVARDRRLGKYLSGAHGCQAGGWEGGRGHKLLMGHWRAVHALELYKIGA